MRDARIERREASLSNPSRNFHARSRSFSGQVQPGAKIRTVLQSSFEKYRVSFGGRMLNYANTLSKKAKMRNKEGMIFTKSVQQIYNILNLVVTLLKE